MRKIIFLMTLITWGLYSQNTKPNLFIFKKNQKYGVIDTKMKIVIQPEYDKLRLSYDNKSIIYWKNSQTGILDIKGKELIVEVDNIFQTNHPEFYKFSLKGKEYSFYSNGIMNSKGDIIIKPDYGFHSTIINNLNRIIMTKSGFEYLFDTKGKLIKQFRFPGFYRSLLESSNLIPFYENKKYGYMDKDGNVIIESRFRDAKPFNGEYAIIKLDGYFTFLNENGEIESSHIYDKIDYWINRNTYFEKTSISFNYLAPKKKFYYVKKNGKMGVLNKDLDIIVPIIYDEVGTFSEGFAMVKMGRKYGFVNEDGKIIIPIIYEHADYFSEGLAPVVREGKWGFIDKHNNVSYRV